MTGLFDYPPVQMFRKMKGYREFPIEQSGDGIDHLMNHVLVVYNLSKNIFRRRFIAFGQFRRSEVGDHGEVGSFDDVAQSESFRGCESGGLRKNSSELPVPKGRRLFGQPRRDFG